MRKYYGKTFKSWPSRLRLQERSYYCFLIFSIISTIACGSPAKPEAEANEEPLARTKFTNRIENFFEYAPLRAGKPSQFLIHLTDLSDGTPVEKADVPLTIRKAGGGQASEVKSKVGA